MQVSWERLWRHEYGIWVLVYTCKQQKKSNIHVGVVIPKTFSQLVVKAECAVFLHPKQRRGDGWHHRENVTLRRQPPIQPPIGASVRPEQTATIRECYENSRRIMVMMLFSRAKWQYSLCIAAWYHYENVVLNWGQEAGTDLVNRKEKNKVNKVFKDVQRTWM